MPSQRLDWVDSAKGLSIVGVCLMHVVTGVPGGPETALGQFSAVLDPLRMPLFFLISGLFSHRVLQRSLPDLWFRRLWFLLIPYLVFSPFQAAIRLDIEGKLTTLNVIKSLIFGDPGLWFLFALMAYNVLAWVLRTLPGWLAVLLSTIPLIVCVGMGWVEQQWPRNLVQYAPIFMIGLHYRSFFLDLAPKAFRPLTVTWAVGLFAMMEMFYRSLHSTIWAEWSAEVAQQTTMFALVRNVSALPLGVLVGVWLVHLPVVRTILTAVGRHTLPVYASHHIMLHVVNALLLPALFARSADVALFYEDISVRLATGVLTCVASGLVFYAIGRIPVVGWILYPPPLPRRTARRNTYHESTQLKPMER